MIFEFSWDGMTFGCVLKFLYLHGCGPHHNNVNGASISNVLIMSINFVKVVKLESNNIHFILLYYFIIFPFQFCGFKSLAIFSQIYI
jgi:hypothetical protein